VNAFNPPILVYTGHTPVAEQAAFIQQAAVDRHARHSDEHVLKLLVGHVRSLRYWQTGFDEDDEEAIHWRDFFSHQVDELLEVLKARGIQ
jgi:hypothetical protein